MILRENSSEIMNILGEHIAEIALRPDRLTTSLIRARAEVALAQLDRFISGERRLSWKRPDAGLIGPLPGWRARPPNPLPGACLARPGTPSRCREPPMASRITCVWVWGAGLLRGLRTGLLG